MKRILFIAVASCLLVSACNHPVKEAEKTPDTSFSVNTLTVEDSLQFPPERVEEWMDNDMARYSAEVDVPVTENEVLRNNIIQWMGSLLNEDYNGDPKDLEAMVAYDKAYFLSLETGEPRTVLQRAIKMVEENDRYVSYYGDTWEYNGGAHGATYMNGATFSKATGERFTTRMFKDAEPLPGMIWEALKEQYFNPLLEGTGITAEEAVYAEVAESLPMPDSDPWIQNDTVRFIYQDYEIAAHALGLPECGIPYADLKDCLTDAGKAFFASPEKK